MTDDSVCEVKDREEDCEHLEDNFRQQMDGRTIIHKQQEAAKSFSGEFDAPHPEEPKSQHENGDETEPWEEATVAQAGGSTGRSEGDTSVQNLNSVTSVAKASSDEGDAAEVAHEASADLIQTNSTDAINGLLNTLETSYGQWTAITGRSNKHAYRALGCIYELAPHIKPASEAQRLLVEKVRAATGKPIGSRWDPHAKSGQELCLTLLFGLKEHRSTKTQWKNALEGAAAKGIDANADSFVDFITPIGIEKAGLHAKSGKAKVSPADQIKQWRDSLPDISDELFVVPRPEGQMECEELVVTISRVEQGRDGENDYFVRPIQSIADRGIVLRVIECLKKLQPAMEKNVLKTGEACKKALEKKLKDSWRSKWKKAFARKETTMTLLEFALDNEGRGWSIDEYRYQDYVDLGVPFF